MFDRRVPDELMRVLLPGGPFSWVTGWRDSPSRRAPPRSTLDFEPVRRAVGAGDATLYLGTTQVFGVHVRADGLFRLSGHQRGGLFQDVEAAVRRRLE